MLLRSAADRQVAHVDAAHEHRAAWRLVHPADEGAQSGLAAARRAHHRDHAPRRDRERDVAQRGLTVGIGKREVPELDRASAKGSQPARPTHPRVRPIGHAGNRVQDLDDPFHGRHPAAHDGERPAQRDSGPGQIGEIAVEGHEGAQRDAALDHGAPAEPEHDEAAHSRAQAHERPESRLGAGQSQAAQEVLGVEPAEALDLPRLHGVGPHHRHAGEVLLHLGGEHAELLLDGDGLLVHRVAESLGRQHQERRRRQRPEGEPGIDAPHGGQRAGEGQRGRHQHGAAEARQGADIAHVAGGARHEITGAMRVVERGRAAEKGRIEIPADVMLHPLPGADHDEARAEAGQAVQRRQRQDEQGEAGERVAVRARGERVHGALHRPGNGQRERGGEDEARHSREIAGEIGTEVAEEPPSRGHRLSIDAVPAGAGTVQPTASRGRPSRNGRRAA